MENYNEQLQKKYEIIESRLKELSKIKDESYKTSTNFRYNPSNSYSSIDISTETRISELINVNAFIQTKCAQYKESAEQLGLKEFPVFKWLGYDDELWKHDIILRIKILGMKDEFENLKNIKRKIEEFLPSEHKIKQLLLEIPSINE